MTTPHTDIAGLEAIYDALALAIDDAPDDGRERLLAKVALLVSCPCDLGAWRVHMKALQHGDPIWDRLVASLSSLDLAPRVPKGDKVRMMVGLADEVAPPDLTQRYAAALAGRGVDVEVTQLPGKDHEIFLEPEVQAALKALLAAQP